MPPADHRVAPQLLLGDCRDQLKTLPVNGVDSVVTDPPYELGFMGKKWDATGIAYDPKMWREVLRVLKPGAHLLAFGGTRTYHRMACAIEDAGFEIRDQMQWLYGSGFPKSHNLEGNWKGWGTALKPANEPICMARKPLIGTVAENVQTFRTGAINIYASRIGTGNDRIAGGNAGASDSDHTAMGGGWNAGRLPRPTGGRWPANVVLDEEAGAILDTHVGVRVSRYGKVGHRRAAPGSFGLGGDGEKNVEYADTFGYVSRFFYCAKASRRERSAGLPAGERSDHPTVKPLSLMCYLVRLVTPPGGSVLDPFMGSGTTACAAVAEGFSFVGIEKEAEYMEIAEARIAEAQEKKRIADAQSSLLDDLAEA